MHAPNDEEVAVREIVRAAHNASLADTAFPSFEEAPDYVPGGKKVTAELATRQSLPLWCIQ